MTSPPGYYAAMGDPPGTVRYWDGGQWTSEPMEPPPGWGTPEAAVDERFARVWVRIGATLIDGLVSTILVIPFMIEMFRDVFDQIDAGVEADQVEVNVPSSVYLVGLAVFVVFLLMVAFLGGTPGKLLLQLRITREDGAATPPGLGKAARRATPALLGAIPIVGALASIVLLLLNLVWVNTDSERRSAYDRIAGTRVVYKNHL